MKKKIIKGLKHYGMLCFSPVYRKKVEIIEGQKVWQKLDEKLEPAVGIVFDDDERLDAFKRMSLYLTSTELLALKRFLRQKIEETEYSFANSKSLGQEVEKCRQRQIFKEHLAVL